MTTITVSENGNIRGVFTKVISASLSDSLSGECTFEFSVTSAMAKNIFTGTKAECYTNILSKLTFWLVRWLNI